MKYLYSTIFCVSFIFVLLASNCVAQQPPKDDSSNLDGILNLKVDTYPCRDIQLSNVVREIDRNIIAFLNYEQGNLISIEIKPTCDFKEARMPKDVGYPVMSERTFRRVMAKLERLKPIGRMVERAKVNAVTGTLRLYTDKYQNAKVEVWGYNCQKQRRGFGCGIRKFIVYYSPDGI